MTTTSTHWADVLQLRDEVRATDGSVGELQMSLAKAVYQTVAVPYAKCDYYTDITEPTPKLVGFLGRVARRLGVTGRDAHACFHLDQGMGGGKSHALVGVWHMVHDPDAFFATDLGQQVHTAAGTGGHPVDLSAVVPVVLTCDGFSPGKTDPRFGPSTDLFGRFLWTLFADHADRMGRWQHYIDRGANKATIHDAFAEVARPVLVLIDELMDYVMALTDQSAIGGMPGEQAFLNALSDAVDDQPNVALVVVMIRSDEDAAGYHPAAAEMREYLSDRLQRNGETVTVTESADFANIIRRRLFHRIDITDAATRTGNAYAHSATGPWSEHVYAHLGAGRGAANLPSRVVETYPFHPDLFALVSKEWTVVQAFQRVRSTVAIFARTVLYWADQHAAGHWVPPLIGPGDVPLQTDALEALLSSGVLAGNDRAIQGYRAVATTDVINSGGGGGTALVLDRTLAGNGVDAHQPTPAVRMATACFLYSLVARPRGLRGATRAELLASVHDPAVEYAAAEEVLNALVAGPGDGGLGALERTRASSGKVAAERFYLSIKQTLTMYHANAAGMVSNEQALDYLWQRVQKIARKGEWFPTLHFVARPDDPATSLATVFGDVYAQENRLVVLDPRRWTLLNGKDAATRADLDAAFGITAGIGGTFAASMVIAVANTQRRDRARAAAKDALAWKGVVAQLNPEDEEHQDAIDRRDKAITKLDDDIRRAYQHYCYLMKTSAGVHVEYKTVAEGATSLNGGSVWDALVAESRAVGAGKLAAAYVAQLIDQFDRALTPKELFEQPYSNPVWPLIAQFADMRRAVFELATSTAWMLRDSDGNEVVPAAPEQIQPATLQQTLVRRPEPGAGEGDGKGAGEGQAGTDGAATGSGGAAPGGGTQGGETQRGTGTATGGTGVSGTDVGYEWTTLSLPDTSLTDPARMEAVWMLLREMASLVDPAKAHAYDVQMIRLAIGINARTGDTQAILDKAAGLPNAQADTEPDDM